MKWMNLNRDWKFMRGKYMYMSAAARKDFGETVQLPHDYMIGQDVEKDAPAQTAMGFYTGAAATYTKELEIPKEWEGEKIYLYFDGVMLNASVSVNGSFAALHHYGYTPFWVEISDYVSFGRTNRIAVSVNPSMQPNSRWYTGAGIYRDVKLAHTSPLHIACDGIFIWTKRLEGIDEKGEAAQASYNMAEVVVKNDFAKDRQVRVTVVLEDNGEEILRRNSVMLIKAGKEQTARVAMSTEAVKLWSSKQPYLYTVKAYVEDMGEFGVSLKKETALAGICDEAQTTFGIRTFSADAGRGLLVNGKSVKLKGGCVHHDNGVLGAVSLYDSEYRKVKKIKELGFNALRMAHNPPSAVLLKVCDELGMYVVDEAFDAWGFSKQPGDYSQFFADCWKEDMEAFIKRDRNHPSILLWSTGNEVEERGGMGNGYAIAEELAGFVRSLDSTRLVTNGLCSMWCGLDDYTVQDNLKKMAEQMAGGNMQNVDPSGKNDTAWEDRTESFCNCLDVVGYNYMDSHYAYDHERYPERVILGTESFPMAFDTVWALVEGIPCVIGDFTWTVLDYIGEAGIGRSVFLEKDDPALKIGRQGLSSHSCTYPWRLANDADITIGGEVLAQGVFRRIVWGSKETGLYVQNPENYGKEEVVSGWGWPQMEADWNYDGYVGKPVKVYVYSGAEEVELFLNGKSFGKRKAGRENRYAAVYEIPYEKGELTAVSYSAGGEVSRAELATSKAAAKISLKADKTVLCGDGSSLAYVEAYVTDEAGRRVNGAKLSMTATVEGDAAYLAGFGSDNPVTEDNYTRGECVSYRGRALAVVRAGYQAGEVKLTVSAEGLEGAGISICVE